MFGKTVDSSQQTGTIRTKKLLAGSKGCCAFFSLILFPGLTHRLKYGWASERGHVPLPTPSFPPCGCLRRRKEYLLDSSFVCATCLILLLISSDYKRAMDARTLDEKKWGRQALSSLHIFFLSYAHYFFLLIQMLSSLLYLALHVVLVPFYSSSFFFLLYCLCVRPLF